MKRREYLITVGSICSMSIAGCVGEGDDESAENGQNTGNPGGENEECRTVTETREQHTTDELYTAEAGGGLVIRGEYEEGDTVRVEAVKLDGARPKLTVEDSDRTTVIETDVSEQIEEEFTVHNGGRYYITFDNTALLTTGQWDIDIYVESDIEQTVCD